MRVRSVYGAGKSTTIRLIMNLLRLDKGKIKTFGKNHIKHEKDIKEKNWVCV